MHLRALDGSYAISSGWLNVELLTRDVDPRCACMMLPGSRKLIDHRTPCRILDINSIFSTEDKRAMLDPAFQSVAIPDGLTITFLSPH